jgi:hypothetical protein
MPDDAANPIDLLQGAVDRLARRPGFMANLLGAAFSGDVSATRIAAEFGCSQESALRLALMGEPRSERALFREDIARIAQAAGVDKVRLLSVVKEAQALAAFGEDERGMLLAARDVVSDPGRGED